MLANLYAIARAKNKLRDNCLLAVNLYAAHLREAILAKGQVIVWAFRAWPAWL